MKQAKILTMRSLKPVIGTVIASVILFFIVESLYSNWSKLQIEVFRPDPFFLTLSLMALLMSLLMLVWILQRIFHDLGHQLSYSDVYWIYFRSIVGKYVPGKIWQIAGSTYLATKKGVPGGLSFTAFLLGQVYSVLSGLLLMAFLLTSGLLEISKGIFPLVRWNSIALILLIILVSLRPRLLQKLLNTLLYIFKSQPVKIRSNLQTGLKYLLLYTVCWFTFGVAFWLFVNAFTAIPPDKYLSLTAIHAGAIVIGFLSVLTPGGIGVREGTMVVFLSYTGSFSEPLPQIIAIGMRLVTTISEIISFLLTFIIGRKR